MHNIQDENEIAELSREGPAPTIARRLIDTANEKGTYDNLSAAVCRIVGKMPTRVENNSWQKRLRAWLKSRS